MTGKINVITKFLINQLNLHLKTIMLLRDSKGPFRKYVTQGGAGAKAIFVMERYEKVGGCGSLCTLRYVTQMKI